MTPLGKKVLKTFVALSVLIAAGTTGWYVWNSRNTNPGIVSTDSGGSRPPVTESSNTIPTGPKSGSLGSESNPLTVSIVSWHGYVGGLLANGGLTTTSGSIYANKGINVRFLLDDSIPTMAERFEPNDAQCIWRTIDFWAQEQPALRNVKHDGRMVVIVDNSRGGDRAIGREGVVETVEQLAGHTVGITEFTPSHMLLIYMLDHSSLSKRQRESVQTVTFGSNGEALAAFQSGKIDSLVTWEPETSLAMLPTQGFPKPVSIFDTSMATNLIYDGIVCNTKTISEHPDVIQKFVAGWLEGADQANANPQAAADVLIKSEQSFASLVEKQGRDFLVSNVFSGIRWSTLEDNIRVLGMAGGPNQFERIYGESDDIWRQNTKLLDGMPKVNVREAFDTQFIRSLSASAPQAKQEAAKPEFTFTEEKKIVVAKTATESLTKPVTINFSTGSATINQRGEQVIEAELVPLLDATQGSYIRLSGNTDSVGSAVVNKKLSLARAQSVADYLVKEWDVPRNRIDVVGNGSSDPLCNEGDQKASGYDTLEDCRAANRTTRVSILSSSK